MEVLLDMVGYIVTVVSDGGVTRHGGVQSNSGV